MWNQTIIGAVMVLSVRRASSDTARLSIPMRRASVMFDAVLAGFLFGFGLGLFSNVSGAVLALYGVGAGLVIAIVGTVVWHR